MLPIGDELRNVLATFAEIEWARCGPCLDSAHGDYSHRIHRTVWRYKQPHDQIEQPIKEAVESFEGCVSWQMTKYGRNWVIAPLHAPMRIGWHTDSADDDLGRASNRDLLKLAAYIQDYVQSRIMN